MLVLSRKTGQEIVIGNNIHITIVAIKGDNVRIGITAPKEVIVDRQEVHDKRMNSPREPASPPTSTSVNGPMPK